MTVQHSSFALGDVIPVILSGGSGTRMWPLSRSMYPKQFIKFSSDQATSLLGDALRRLDPQYGFAAPIIVTNNDHRFLIEQEARGLGIEPGAIVLEPAARNTAPAIAVAALKALQTSKNAVIAVMPSDHVIRDGAGFAKAVSEAATIAASGKLVLFGIHPDDPNTGYGYIKRGDKLSSVSGAYEVATFTEKPDLRTAEQCLADGSYYWNSGVFVLHCQTFLAELAMFAPEILATAERGLDEAVGDLGFLRLGQTFAQSPAISIDHAVMEKTSKAVIVPISVGWNDVGSWSSLWAISKQDDKGNVAQGEVVMHESAGCYVHSSNRLVTTLGVKDLVIVETADAMLVADKSRSQEVSTLVGDLKRRNLNQHAQHVKNARPWGFFETLNISARSQVKLLHVKPGGKLSMQMHHHRSEHWIVVQGTALVTIDGVEKLVRENESTYITATQWHRLENPGKVPLEIIEVQIGTYLGEDDIIRSDDVYNRSADEVR